MAANLRPLFLAIISLLMISCLIRSSEGSVAGIYWGRSSREANLSEICTNSTYEIVVIASLKFVGYQAVLELDHHCAPSINGSCAFLGAQIESCQSKGIKVFVSLDGRPDFCSRDVQYVAEHIWNNFLGGQSDSRPFGDAVVDGIDFHIQSGSNRYLDALAETLSKYSTADKKVYLSAAPRCRIPDYYLDIAIKKGLFDYVWVQFFEEPSCDYSSGNITNLSISWEEWHSYVPDNTALFLGLTGISGVEGYIKCRDLRNVVIPYVEQYSKYGGLMVLEGTTYCGHYDEIIRPYVKL
ncbi:unnamed protein product [Coffea canephora]|uniref:GH18 domain-containing protein n=1 Tax=Coffea canephora TaxID=49390 RepID=A0A068VAI9_COFCA|nr:unnamed protein product [Coffea canephora]